LNNFKTAIQERNSAPKRQRPRERGKKDRIGCDDSLGVQKKNDLYKATEFAQREQALKKERNPRKKNERPFSRRPEQGAHGIEMVKNL